MGGAHLRGIPLRGGIRLGIPLPSLSSRGDSSSGNASAAFVSVGEFVFGGQFVLGEARARRRAIRLRGLRLVFGECICGIRLRNPSSSADGKVMPAQRPQCMYI